MTNLHLQPREEGGYYFYAGLLPRRREASPLGNEPLEDVKKTLMSGSNREWQHFLLEHIIDGRIVSSPTALYTTCYAALDDVKAIEYRFKFLDKR